VKNLRHLRASGIQNDAGARSTKVVNQFSYSLTGIDCALRAAIVEA
jgi:hypothetical protein